MHVLILAMVLAQPPTVPGPPVVPGTVIPKVIYTLPQIPAAKESFPEYNDALAQSKEQRKMMATFIGGAPFRPVKGMIVTKTNELFGDSRLRIVISDGDGNYVKTLPWAATDAQIRLEPAPLARTFRQAAPANCAT